MNQDQNPNSGQPLVSIAEGTWQLINSFNLCLVHVKESKFENDQAIILQSLGGSTQQTVQISESSSDSNYFTIQPLPASSSDTVFVLDLTAQTTGTAVVINQLDASSDSQLWKFTFHSDSYSWHIVNKATDAETGASLYLTRSSEKDGSNNLVIATNDTVGDSNWIVGEIFDGAPAG